MHNTFTVKEDKDFIVTSHNFPEVTATGSSLKEAVANLNSAIESACTKNPNLLAQSIAARKKLGVICMCGYTTESQAVSVIVNNKVKATKEYDNV